MAAYLFSIHVRKIGILFATFVLVLSVINPVHASQTLDWRAGGATWQPIGPQGGTIHAISIALSKPSIIYTATDLGVYKSSDAGNQWIFSSTGLNFRGVSSVAVDPTNPKTVYASPYDWQAGGLYKSTDGGAHWVASNAGLIGQDIEEISIDPKHPSVIYAQNTNSQINKSSDAGKTWTRLDVEPLGIYIQPPGHFVFQPRYPVCDFTGWGLQEHKCWQPMDEGGWRIIPPERRRPGCFTGFSRCGLRFQSRRGTIQKYGWWE